VANAGENSGLCTVGLNLFDPTSWIHKTYYYFRLSYKLIVTRRFLWPEVTGCKSKCLGYTAGAFVCMKLNSDRISLVVSFILWLCHLYHCHEIETSRSCLHLSTSFFLRPELARSENKKSSSRNRLLVEYKHDSGRLRSNSKMAPFKITMHLTNQHFSI
jgi:hypothetical protein